MRIKAFFKKIFFEWEWLCAFRLCNQSFDFDKSNKKFFYKVISIKKGFWAADPFLIQKDDKIYCFFEYCCKKKRKAAIFGKELYPTEGKEFFIHEFEGHSSYPCVFEFKGNYYMIPETKYSRSVRLLKCTKWPNQWKEVSVLIDSVDAADSTIFFHNNESFLYIYEENNAFNQLSLYRLDLNLASLGDLVFKKIYDKGEARPGGFVLFMQNKEYRVIQPCRDHYGEKLEFSEIKFDGFKYEECLSGELLPEQIILDKKGKIIGVHTLNRCNSFEVIDVLMEGHFSLFRPIKWIFSKIGIFGYGRYDDKKKYLFKK